MMTELQKERFATLRKKVAKEIEAYLEDDCGHKSYEGTWELSISFPDYFEDSNATEGPDYYRMVLHCYIICPNRHYAWHGKSWDECLTKCEKDIAAWLGQGVEDDD